MRMLIALAALALGGLCLAARMTHPPAPAAYRYPVTRTDAEWRKRLTPAQYGILRQAGTEAPGTGKYNHFWKAGTYVCAGCGQKLFLSKTKYDAHEGWPSFWDAADPKAVRLIPDHSFGMDRTEVVCARCGGHLGHRFDDGPRPTGKRYCIDSDALIFIPSKG